MDVAELFTRIAAELALFAGLGFLIFAANDLAVDLIYFTRRIWRAMSVYSRLPRAFASDLRAFRTRGPYKPDSSRSWCQRGDEAGGDRVHAARRVKRIEYRHTNGSSSVTIATIRRPLAALQALRYPRRSGAGRGRGTDDKADCLNYLHDALIAYEVDTNQTARLSSA